MCIYIYIGYIDFCMLLQNCSVPTYISVYVSVDMHRFYIVSNIYTYRLRVHLSCFIYIYIYMFV